jgi:hypothetical protein
MKPSERIKEMEAKARKEWGTRALIPKDEWFTLAAIISYLDEEYLLSEKPLVT